LIEFIEVNLALEEELEQYEGEFEWNELLKNNSCYPEC
jgi:hypothetical protein